MHTQPAHHSIASQTASNPSTPAATKRTKKEYAQTIEAIENGDIRLSCTAAKFYKLLVDLDYVDKATGYCKGYIYYSTDKLADKIDRSVRTVERRLKALEKAGLLSRRQRANTSSLLYLQVITAAQEPTVEEQRHEEKQDTATCPQQERAERQKNVDNQKSVVRPPASKVSFAYKGYETGKTQKTYHSQYPGAGRDIASAKLAKLGFDPFLARLFVAKYGAERIEQQITNLCYHLNRRIAIRDFARWLNTAIRFNDGQGFPVEPQHTTLRQPVTQAENPRLCLAQNFIEVTDENGYTYYSEIEKHLCEPPIEAAGVAT